jgi:RNA polymerase sigma factor (sigma-70 family)
MPGSAIIRTILIQVAYQRPATAGLQAPVPGYRQPHLGFAVLERYHRELLNFLTRQVSDRDTAADLAQESFVRVLSAQSSGRVVLDMRALLYRTARNLVIDQHRRNEVRQHDHLDAIPEDQQPPAPQHLQPEEALASQQVIRAYVVTIEALPARCREAFVLHIFDELSHAQIARHMGISVSMVEKHVVRGMVACKLCERRLREPAGPLPEAQA